MLRDITYGALSSIYKRDKFDEKIWSHGEASDHRLVLHPLLDLKSHKKEDQAIVDEKAQERLALSIEKRIEQVKLLPDDNLIKMNLLKPYQDAVRLIRGEIIESKEDDEQKEVK